MTEELQAYRERKEHKDRRDPQAPPDPLAHRERLDQLARPVRLDPKGPLARGARKGATEDADHPGLVELRECRAFLDPEDRKVKEGQVDHRDLPDYQVLAAHLDRRELRETKVNLVKPVVMDDLERRATKGRKVTQVPQGSQAHRADLVERDRKVTEGIPVRRVSQDNEVPPAHQDPKDLWVHLDPQDPRAHQGHKVLREVVVQRGRTDSQVPQEQEVLQALGEMMETPAIPVSRESLGLVDSVDLMAILVTRATVVHQDPKG